MRHTIRRLHSLALALAVALAPQVVTAQRIYDKDKDDQAQQASQQAAQIANAPVFEKQLKNLNLIVNQDFATYFMGAKRQMNLDINSFITWGGVAKAVQDVERSTQEANPYATTDVDTIRKELAAEKKAAADALAALKKSAKKDDGTVPVNFQRLGDVEALAGFADELLNRSVTSPDKEQLLTGVKKVQDTLTALKDLYNTYITKMKEIDDLSRDLVALKIPMQQVALARLQVEEQHWKTVGAIQARRASDEADVRELIHTFEVRAQQLGLGNTMDEVAHNTTNIEDTISDVVEVSGGDKLGDARDHLREATAVRRESERKFNDARGAFEEASRGRDKKATARAKGNADRAEKELADARAAADAAEKEVASIRNNVKADRKRLASYLEVLYVAAALSSHGRTPSSLAALRLAQEEHRYSIRKSAVFAQAYEATLSTGTQRLALYYKGGLKPEKIAQLIYSAATVAIPPAILAR